VIISSRGLAGIYSLRSVEASHMAARDPRRISYAGAYIRRGAIKESALPVDNGQE
jgi:hypothetical protein